MSSRVTLTVVLAALVVGAVLVIPTASARFVGGTGPDANRSAVELIDPTLAMAESPEPPAVPTLRAVPVSVPVDGFMTWALLDRDSGEIGGSANMTETSSTESMIKIWIVADYLRQLDDAEPDSTILQQASLAIRDSDDRATDLLFYRAGGEDVITRMIKMCGLQQTRMVVPPEEDNVWWSYTQMSARDAVLMGECVKNGTAAGPLWTDWVLDEMSQVRGGIAASEQEPTSGGGRWGIIDGLPESLLRESPVGIKNGWTLIWADGMWHLNCLAVHDDWVLAVMTRYPGPYGLEYGAGICREVARQLVTPHAGAAIQPPAVLPPSATPTS
ncbi:serine hydrolase [Solwaraspora sp. WMMD937]|uniref:serine hydrolase n=1 Tax=Solwaraspora sp. WMMD937 TaxID=3016090 RepID=UPI00249A6F66|nr:serine hydrolase [Solwaraspora sp. WMMD937]WFE23055.1 serine hydrolase [Solwaraspora sp. WMMD937]